MGGTFENRLLTTPVRHRLGGSLKYRNPPNHDLREKLNSNFRKSDARSLLNNRRSNVRSKLIDARSLLRNKPRRSRNNVPCTIPMKTVRNDLFRRSAARKAIPSLLSLPTIPPASLEFLKSSNPPSGIMAELQSVVDPVGSHVRGTSFLSPIQGFRLDVRNLHSTVTVDDIYELFGSIGTLRLCNIIRPGQAEVVFNDAESSLEAVKRYHNRELDGRPMHVTLLTPVNDRVTVQHLSTRLGPLIRKSTSNGNQNVNQPKGIEMDVIRKALFNVSVPSTIPRRPVDFNVSLL